MFVICLEGFNTHSAVGDLGWRRLPEEEQFEDVALGRRLLGDPAEEEEEGEGEEEEGRFHVVSGT